MNKLFKKISMAFVGIAMAVGVGVAIGSRPEAKIVNADGPTTVSFNTNNSTIEEKGDGKTLTSGGITLTFSSLTAVGTNFVQNAKNATITSTATPGLISSIKIYDCATTSTKTDGGFIVYGGTSADSITTSIDSVSGLSSEAADKTISFAGKSVTYFKVVNGADRVLKHSKIDVTYAAPVAVTGVSLNKDKTSISVGSTETLTATVAPADATNQNVTWSSADSSIASVNSKTGVVTGVAAGGPVNITATTTDGSFTASCAVTVTAAVAVEGVSVKPSTTIMAGYTETLTPTFDPVDATNQNVSWESDNTSVATVSDAGVVTGVSAGKANITVTTEDGGKTASCAVTVTPYSGGTYHKVTTKPADIRGTYLFVYEDEEDDTKGYVFDSTMETFDTVKKTISATISSSTIVADKKVLDGAVVKIERDTIDEVSYYFAKCGNGEYLSRSSNISHVKEKSASVAVDLTDGLDFKIGTYFLRFNAGSDQMRFRFYSSKSVKGIALYKLDETDATAEANTFGTAFMGSFTCNDTVGSNNITDDIWNAQATAFNSLSVDAQGILASATGNESGSAHQQAIARYDYIVKKYTTSVRADFMNRISAGKLVASAAVVNEWNVHTNSDSNLPLIITIVAIGTIPAAGVFLLSRRRRDEE